MRIFIVSRGYPTKEYATQGIFEYDQAKALAARGHEVVLLVLDLRSPTKKRKLGYFSLDRDHVHLEIASIPVSNVIPSLTQAVRIKALKKLYRTSVLKYGRPEIIHAHFQQIGYATVRALGDEHVPMVMTEHLSKLINDEFNQELQKAGDKTYRHFDSMIVVSNALAASLRDKFGIHAEVIPNIVDLSSFRYQGDTRPTDHFCVISVAHLKKVKRMDDLINAFALFHESYPNAILRIFGMGVEYEMLKKLIRDKDLEDAVTLEGLRPREEIAQAMKTASCFALFSASETFGVSFIEAISMGLPVIASRCQGPEDFITEENGIMVDVGDIDAMKDAFEYMVQNREKYDGQEISRSINERFSPDVIAQQIEAVYLKTVRQKD